MKDSTFGRTAWLKINATERLSPLLLSKYSTSEDVAIVYDILLSTMNIISYFAKAEILVYIAL